MAFDSKGTLNKVMIIGRLGQDPELKYTQSGVAVLQVSLATDTTWKDQDGNQQVKTEWHRVVFWRKTAELVAQYNKKGDRLYVEGKLTTRSWEDNGQKRYMTEIVADNQQSLGSRPAGGGTSDGSAPPPPEPPTSADETTEPVDDLPF